MPIGSSHRLLLAFFLGAGAGVVLDGHAAALQPLAELFIVGLKALAPPVTLLVLVSALSSFRAGLGRLALMAVGGFLVTGLAAALIGVGLAELMNVGRGFHLAVPSTEPAKADAGPGAMLTALIRSPWTYGAFYAGFLLLHMRVRMRNHDDQAQGWRGELTLALNTAYRMLGGLMQYAPVGVFALMAITFDRLRLDAATALLTLLCAVYLGQVLVFACCLWVLKFAGQGPGAFLLKVKDVLLTALVTGSSAACASLEFAVAEQRLGIARDRLGLILPLGLGMYKLGTAVYQAAVILFTAHAAGHELAVPGLLAMSMLALAASVLTPPVSGGSWVALGLVFAAADLPPEAIAVAASVPLLGKLNTPLNSLGRLAGLRLLADKPAPTADRRAMRGLCASGTPEQS